ncbi:MAG: hypothetical protein V3V15_05880 [Sphingorhabdus sp.]
MKVAKSYSDFILKHAGLKWLLALNALYVFWIAAMMPFLAASFSSADAPGPLDLSFAYSASEAFDRVAQFGAAGRHNYMVFLLTADVIYPVIYTATLSFTIAFLAKKAAIAEHLTRLLTALPVIVFMLDICENISISSLLWSFPAKIVPLAWAASIFTSLKWTGVATAMFITLTLLALAIFKAMRK